MNKKEETSFKSDPNGALLWAALEHARKFIKERI